MRTKFFIISLLTILLTSVAFAAFIVIDEQRELPVVDIENPETTKHKVEFKYNGSVVETMYVNDGYVLSLKDAPFVSKTQGETVNNLVWKNNNLFLNDHITVNKDLVLEASNIDDANIYKDAIETHENLEKGFVDVSKPKNTVNLDKYLYNNSIKAFVSEIDGQQSGFLKPLYSGTYNYKEVLNVSAGDRYDAINLKLKADGSLNLGAQLSNNKKFNIPGKDSTISLESTDGTTSTYKPNLGKTTTENSTNYLVSKFVLQNDIVITNSVTMGAITGYAALETDYRQQDMQGMIVGSYNEIDLNGHDLVVTDKATLDLWGSITDSSENRTGNIILEKGSTMYSPFVFEDHHNEFGLAESYEASNAPFAMYRMPYIDCNMVIKSGANLYGKTRVSVSAQGNDTYSGDIKLVGSDASSMIQITNEEGYLKRTVTYDEEILKYDKSNKIKNNLMHQKIKYEAHDANIIFNGYEISMKISAFSFNLDSKKFQFVIPPYFDISLKNTTATINQELVFMPGSNLVVDKDSKLIFTNTNVLTQPGVSLIFDAQKYQGVGGLHMMDRYYKFTEGKSLADRANSWGEDKLMSIDEFFTNLKPAVADIDGDIEIVKNGNDLMHKFSFGGIINIDNLDNFKKQITPDVNLYSSYFTTGPNGKTGLANLSKINILMYNVLPLLNSEDDKLRLMVDITKDGYNTLSKTNYYYDSKTGLISDGNNYYAYIFDEYGKANNVYKSFNNENLGVKDSLDGKFVKGTFDKTSGFFNANETNYAFFRGAFIPKTDRFNNDKFYMQDATVAALNLKFENGIWVKA